MLFRIAIILVIVGLIVIIFLSDEGRNWLLDRLDDARGLLR